MAAVIDLTAGDGNLACVCLSHKIPYLGVCFNEAHRLALHTRMAQVVFMMYLDPNSPLHDANLCASMKTTTEHGGTAKAAAVTTCAAGEAGGKGAKAGGTGEKGDANTGNRPVQGQGLHK